MFKIVYQRQAIKALKRMPSNYAERFKSAFDAIAVEQTEALDIKPLDGRPGYRLRIGQWRAMYEIDNGKLMIYVLKIGARGDVYK